MKKKYTYQRILEQEIFRSKCAHPKLKKGLIGTTTLLGSASMALSSTSILAHASETTVPTENKATAGETTPTSGPITFASAETVSSTSVVKNEVAASANTNEQTVEKPVVQEGAGNSSQNIAEAGKEEVLDQENQTTQPDTEKLAATNSSEEETPTPVQTEDEKPAPNPGEEVETPTPDPGDTDEDEKPDPGKEDEKPTPDPEPDDEEPAPKPEPEIPAPERPKPAEPIVEEPTPEPAYEVNYVQETVEQPIQEPVTAPIIVHSPENVVPVGPQQTTVGHGSIKFDRNLTTTEFIEEIGEAAREVGQEHDLYASVMIAQAILESGSGGSQLAQAPNYNLFGIKGEHEGKSVSFATQEDTGGGNMTTIQASFRAYDDYEDCFEDYAELLKEGISGNPDFYKGAWKTTTENYEEATAFLTGKYATDTSYNKKLNGLIETYNLTQYDHPKEEGEATNQVASSGYLLPLNDFVVSSSFGMRGSEFHRGIDLAAGEGMPIFASKAGTVLIAEYHYSWGNYVVIQHDNGETTLYAHQRNFAVNAGERVEQGQTIGFVGSTGNSTGSHLHFELCLDSTLAVERLVDPATVLF